jgi:hypothetical protein
MQTSTDRTSTTIAFHAIVLRNMDRCLFNLSIAPDSIDIYSKGAAAVVYPRVPKLT